MTASYLSGRKIPLALCYHAVSDRLDHALAVKPKRLREQVALLAARGYRSVTFSELETMRRSGEDADDIVAVTFDDGYASTALAGEILGEFGFVATVYVLPPALGSPEPLSWPGIEHLANGAAREELQPLTWDDVDSLHSAGWEIGSHTLTHPKLPTLGDTALAEQLGASRRMLVGRLGSCDSVAYPFGAANARVAAAARAAGYANGTTLSRWHRKDEPYLRPRVGVYLGDDLRRFRRKIAPWSRVARALALGRRAPVSG